MWQPRIRLLLAVEAAQARSDTELAVDGFVAARSHRETRGAEDRAQHGGSVGEIGKHPVRAGGAWSTYR